MKIKVYNSLNKRVTNNAYLKNLEAHGINDKMVKNYLDSLVSHGLSDESNAIRAIEAQNSNRDFLNTTEPRMILYSAEINPYLYPDNGFMKLSRNDAAFAASGEIKKQQSSSAGPTVTKGRLYPKSLAHGDNAPTQTVKVRKNTSNDWAIEYFYTTPDAITRELTSEVKYNARQELLQAHADVINLSTANFTAVEWSQGEVGVGVTVDVTTGSNQFVFTSGTATRLSTVPGNLATTIKKITVEDMLNVKNAFVRQQITGQAGSMYFLPTPEQYKDLLSIPEFVDFEKTGRESRLIKGEVGTILNITVLNPRFRDDWSANVLYSYTALVGNDTDLTKVEDTAVAAAGMTSAGLFWMDTQVERAEGSAIVFPWLNSPIYMGDVYAVETRYSAKRRRNDGNGVVMLIDNPF